MSNLVKWKEAKSHAQVMQLQVKGIVKLAFIAHVDSMTSNIVDSFNHGTIKSVHENIKGMFQFVDAKSKSHKSSRVVGADGRPAQSILDEKRVFRVHFCGGFVWIPPIL